MAKKLQNILLLAIIVLLAGTTAAFAKPNYLTDFNTAYGTSNTILNTCELCHPGFNTKAFTTYATDFKNNGHNFSAIEGTDSDGDGFSNIEEINALTFPGDASSSPAPAADTTPPSAPSALTASVMGSGSVSLSWNAASDNVGVTGYLVFRNGIQIGTTGSTNYGDMTAAPSTTYDYTIKATDAEGNISAASNTASVTTPSSGGGGGGPTVDSIGVFRNGMWYLDSNGNMGWQGGSDAVVGFGSSGDIPVTGDWDGDGTTDISVFRDGMWYLDSNGIVGWQNGDAAVKFGMSTDVPVAGDWDGDGTTDIGVFRNGMWYLDTDGNMGWQSGDTAVKFGMSTDVPVTGDWDGDGATDIGVFRNGMWYLDTDGNMGWQSGDTAVKFGASTDVPVTGDWDGDGATDIGVFREGWLYLDSNSSLSWDGTDETIKFGMPSDTPVVGKW